MNARVAACLLMATALFLPARASGLRTQGAAAGSGQAKRDAPNVVVAASTGSGANAIERVTWARPLSAAEARAISVTAVRAGADHWDPLRVPARPSATKAVDVRLPGPR